MDPKGVTQTIPSGSSIDPDLEVGTTVGEYRVEGKLGQGGFGAVFKAAHPLIGKVVAIKVLSQRFSVDPEMVSRFVAEARAVNQIRHRNIIDIFSFGQLADGRHYYVMEYMDGETLDRRIDRSRLTLVEAIPILRAIARALDTAHGKGIAHRDLKAENVFLGTDADGGVFPKLLDFGIAKLMGPDDGITHKTRTGSPMGTPYYMSPEQTKGRDVDHRTDHYAFGVLAYLMLTGKYPLDGDDYMTILMRQVNDDPPPASQYVPELAEDVDHTLAWLMRKTPAERPPDLMTAVRVLEAVAGVQSSSTDQLASARTPTGLRRFPTATTSRPGMPATSSQIGAPAPAASRRLVLAIAGVLLIAAAVVTTVLVTRRSGEDRAAGSGSAPLTVPPGLDAATAVVAVEAGETVVAIDAPALSANVTITLDGAPPNTEVRVGGQLFGTAPRVVVPRGPQEVMLVLSADGYAPLSLSITPDRDQHHPAKLKARGRPPSRGSNARGSGSAEPTDDIENFPK